VPTNAQLAQAVAHINTLDPKPDAVIASGDLTDHRRAEEYDMLREILADLIPPVFVIPGNHDRREVLLNASASENYMPPPDALFVDYVVDGFPLRLVGLDTTVPDHDYGMMCEERLRWLDNTLSTRPDSPTLILCITRHFARVCNGWMRPGCMAVG
jgi:Icc protein